MRPSRRERMLELREMFVLAARTVGGRRFYLAAFLPLIWPIILVIRAMIIGKQSFEVQDAQNFIIGLPLAVLAIGLGGRVVAGEIDRRTLEIAYTVPGGAHRVWLSKMAAIASILVVSAALLALSARALCGPYPVGALYGAMQAALVYGVLSMAFSTLTRSEATGGMIVGALLLINGVMSGFGNIQMRISPFFNAYAQSVADEVPRDLIAWTVQNRIGMVLLILAVTALTFAQAEKREKLLG